MATKKLTPAQARKIAAAEAAYVEAKRALELAGEERTSVRERYADRIPVGIAMTVGGVTIRRRTQSTGKRFALGRFLKRHKLTPQMQPYVSQGSYEVWEVAAS